MLPNSLACCQISLCTLYPHETCCLISFLTKHAIPTIHAALSSYNAMHSLLPHFVAPRPLCMMINSCFRDTCCHISLLLRYMLSISLPRKTCCSPHSLQIHATPILLPPRYILSHSLPYGTCCPISI